MTAASDPERHSESTEQHGLQHVALPAEDASETAVLTLPASPDAVKQARTVVTERWGWLDDAVLADVELVVAELVSNAVEHGRPEIEVRLRIEPSVVDVAVLDHGPETLPDSTSMSGDTATSGRGLAIIDQLARVWGVVPLPDGTSGKIVWASLSR